MAAGTAALRIACIAAALCAASLCGCQSAPEEKAAQPAPAPAAAPAPGPAPVAEAPAAPVAAPAAVAPPKPAAKPRAPAKKRAPKPKPPAPVVVQPAPAAPPAPQPTSEEERKRKLDAYIAAIARSTVSFNPPSPIPVAQRAAVTLSVTVPPETAALADELRKSLGAGATAWTPRMRTRLSGSDFDIVPAEGRDFDGSRDLAMGGPTEWRWSALPATPGTKKLVATLALGAPPQLGGQRDLPPLQRDVVVEATLSWQAERLWNDYWLWLVVAVVAVAVITLWARRR